MSFELRKLEDVCDILDHMRIPITSRDRKEGPYPYYGANGIQDYIDDFIFDDELVLLAEDGGNFGSKEKPIAYRISGKTWVNNHAHVLKPKNIIDIDYLCYSLMYYDVSGLVNGATRQKLTQSEMRKINIRYRSLEKQRQMVFKIKLISNIISSREHQLSNLNLLVKSRFIEMFGDISTNTKGWNQVPLGELCDISRGGSPRPINNFLGGTVPWIKIGDATDGDNIYLTKTKEHIIEDGVKKSHLVKKGSLIFANCGVSLGFARIITFDGCIHDGWLAFENISASIDKRFLLLTLNMLTKYFRNIAPDGTQPNLNTSIMKKHKQIVPPLTLQKEFISFVAQVDKSKLAIQQSLYELETLKKSLMQQYFG